MLRTLFFSLFIYFKLFAFEPGHVSIFPSSELAAEQAARKIADLIISKHGQKTVLGLATGGTMVAVYGQLKKIVREEAIDLSSVITVNLDEYLDIPPSHPQSYHSFMFHSLFEGLLFSTKNPLGIKEENIHIPTKEIWVKYEEILNDLGPVDLQLLGIGRNGHIAFAEPGTSFDSQTMIVELAETTKQDNARYFDGDLEQVPKRAMTMGISTILKAKEILLIAFGDGKADAIAKTIQGPLSTQIPATALQMHSNVSFLLDEGAASLLKSPHVRRFTHARVLRDHEIQEGELWTAAGKIIPPQPKADEEIDVQGQILAPGFIDLQINGGFGCDFSRNPEQISFVAKELLQFGVTSFLPTVVSSNKEQYQLSLPKLQPSAFDRKRATNLGIHLEGPFFEPSRAGAHNIEFLRTPKDHSVEMVYGDLQGVKLITLAPELPGADHLIKSFNDLGILVAAGHSNATLEQMRMSIAQGVGLTTHLFNAMTPYHHRDPGIVGAALIDPSLPYSLILDGIHLAPETVLLCWRCNPHGLILVSDATEALGLSEGRYKLGTLEIEKCENCIYLPGTRTIAGSNLDLNSAVRMLYSITDCSIAEALEAASLNPAKLIEAYPSKGTLTPGADADFVILSDALEVQATYLGGELCWSKIDKITPISSGERAVILFEEPFP